MVDLRDLAWFIQQRKKDPITKGLTNQQLEFLVYLSNWQEPPSLADIASEMKIHMTRASFLLRSLADRGFVAALREDFDRRMVRISLLPHGRSICERLEQLYRGEE